jgi:hypothetical protein
LLVSLLASLFASLPSRPLIIIIIIIKHAYAGATELATAGTTCLLTGSRCPKTPPRGRCG